MENFKEKIIIALDYGDLKPVKKLLEKLKGRAYFYKIGFELFTSCGAKSIDLVKDYGCKVFLDLKYHDIPNTVYKAVKSAGKLGADIINVHASGGLDMMKAAKMGGEEAARAAGRHIDIIAVTVLTSLSDTDVKQVFYDTDNNAEEKERGERDGIASGLALHLAKLAKISGLDGVVCSGRESLKIKNMLGRDFKTVTPGIRIKAKNVDADMNNGNNTGNRDGEIYGGAVTGKTNSLRGGWADDQKRIMTPSAAFKAGANYIVVGREITEAENPADALMDIYSDIEANFK